MQEMIIFNEAQFLVQSLCVPRLCALFRFLSGSNPQEYVQTDTDKNSTTHIGWSPVLSNVCERKDDLLIEIGENKTKRNKWLFYKRLDVFTKKICSMILLSSLRRRCSNFMLHATLQNIFLSITVTHSRRMNSKMFAFHALNALHCNV